MIEIVATGKCKGCEDMKLRLIEWDASTYEKEIRLYAIRCELQNICDRCENVVNERKIYEC